MTRMLAGSAGISIVAADLWLAVSGVTRRDTWVRLAAPARRLCWRRWRLPVPRLPLLAPHTGTRCRTPLRQRPGAMSPAPEAPAPQVPVHAGREPLPGTGPLAELPRHDGYIVIGADYSVSVRPLAGYVRVTGARGGCTGETPPPWRGPGTAALRAPELVRPYYTDWERRRDEAAS